MPTDPHSEPNPEAGEDLPDAEDIEDGGDSEDEEQAIREATGQVGNL